MTELTPLRPGLITGLHHFELTVSNLDRSIEFYEWLGFRLRMRWNEGPELCATGLGVDGAAIELAQLDGYGVTLELIQFHAAGGATVSAPSIDVGTAHIALVVEDIHEAAAAFAASGASAVSEPIDEQSAYWMQLIDPDGIRVEFIAPRPEGLQPIGAVVSETAPDVDAFSAKQTPSAPVVLNASDSALIVVDMLNDFCDPEGAMPLAGADVLVPVITGLADEFRSAGAPVVWVFDRHDDLDDAEFRKRQPHCLAGTWGAELYSPLTFVEGDREQVKHRFSSFFETDLHEWLQSQGIRTVVVCGVVTNICVRATAQDAFFLGYDVVVVEDASAATSEREQESSLYDIRTHYATVAQSAEVRAAIGAPAA